MLPFQAARVLIESPDQVQGPHLLGVNRNVVCKATKDENTIPAGHTEKI
jgi:hypothetical protein